MRIYPPALPCSVLVRTLSTGQPHSLSANGGVLRLEAPQYLSTGNSKHEISGDFLGMITWRSDKLDDRLLIWNWKTGVLLVSMVRSPPHKALLEKKTHLTCVKNLISQPIRVGSWFDPVFSFLDDRHFVIPSVLAERASEIV